MLIYVHSEKDEKRREEKDKIYQLYTIIKCSKGLKLMLFFIDLWQAYKTLNIASLQTGSLYCSQSFQLLMTENEVEIQK